MKLKPNRDNRSSFYIRRHPQKQTYALQPIIEQIYKKVLTALVVSKASMDKGFTHIACEHVESHFTRYGYNISVAVHTWPNVRVCVENRGFSFRINNCKYILAKASKASFCNLYSKHLKYFLCFEQASRWSSKVMVIKGTIIAFKMIYESIYFYIKGYIHW
jgi:hypothetical protein